MTQKILLSLAVIGVVAGGSIAATGAFFSDTETSTGNTFTAGDIDLGLDNESYYNGVLNAGTSWSLDFDIDSNNGDGDVPRLFFNFADLKPADYGEDTISLHINSNESWLCADVTLTSNDDNTCVEPENDIEGAACNNSLPAANADGDLAQQIEFLWWADDGDNVLEDDETVLPAGALGALGVGNTATVALADDDQNLFSAVAPTLIGPNGGVLTDDDGETLYVGKAWCFGDIAAAPVDDATNPTSPAGNNDGNLPAGQPTDGGYTCNGNSVTNAAQTDSVTLNVGFRAVQARNNPTFQCTTPVVTVNDITT